MHASRLQRPVFILRGAFPPGDDGTGMTHTFAGRRGDPGDIGHHRFAERRFDIRRGFFLFRAADLADQDNAFGLRVLFKQLKTIDEIHAMDRIAPDPHTGTLPQSALGGLMDGFIGERARARDDADTAWLMDIAGHDADLALPGGDDPRTVGANEAGAGILTEAHAELDHIEYRDTLGNAYDHVDTCIRRLRDRLHRISGGHKDHAGFSPGLLYGFTDRIEHRQTEVDLAATPGRDTAHKPGPVLQGLL